jgi:AcrR family transcriptional regulator
VGEPSGYAAHKIETIALMQKQRGTEAVRSVLEPTVPIDVGALSQRQRIVAAMIESCAEKTYAATTIADIVRRASISRTTFYKRFDGKRECFDATLDWCVEELRSAAAESQSSADAPAQAVRKAAAAILGAMAANPALGQLVMGEAVSVEPEVIERYRKLLIPSLESLWGEAGASGTVHTNPRLAFGRAHVLVYNRILSGDIATLPELLPDVVYLSILPFAGHEEALKQARLVGDDDAAEPGDG